MHPTRVLSSSWWLASPAIGIWALVADPVAWPSWWHSVGAVASLRRGKVLAAGPVARTASGWRSLTARPLRLRVFCASGEPGSMIESRVLGDLHGSATWLFAPGDASGTEVTCRWELQLPRGLAGGLGVFAQLLFERRQFARMRFCAQAMGEALGCRMRPLREWSGAQRS